MDTNYDPIAELTPSEEDMALQRLALELQSELENRLGFRLHLLTIDPEAKCLNVYHYPSTRKNLVDHAEVKAAELYTERELDINSIIN